MVVAFKIFCRADFDISVGENVVILMKKRLRDYIIKCLLAAGYDELDVTYGMNTAEHQTIALKK